MTPTHNDGFNPFGSGGEPIAPRTLDQKWHEAALLDLSVSASSRTPVAGRAAKSP